MGAHHSHRAPRVHTSGPVTRILLVGLALAALATIAGLVVLWPSGDRPACHAAGVRPDMVLNQ